MGSLHKNDFDEICRGDRVVLISEDLQDYGWVKWVGKRHPNDPNSELLAGVELDNPVGTDNHKMNGKFLFETLPRHGLLIPAACLVRVEDLLLDEKFSNQQEGESRQKRNNKAVENPLGGDLAHLTAFLQMAFDQLKNSTDKGPLAMCKIHNDLSSTSKFMNGDRENLEILPHMKYGSVFDNQEIQNDIRINSKSVRPRNKLNSVRNIHSEDRKSHNYLTSPDTEPCLNYKSDRQRMTNMHSGFKEKSNVSCDSSRERDVTGGNSPVPSNDFSHMSRNGVDQLEILSIDDEVSVSSEDHQRREDLVVGSMVEIIHHDSSTEEAISKPLYGVIRWIGPVPDDCKEGRLIAGVEMEDLEDGLSDGTLKGRRYFSCPIGKAIFVPLTMCSKDRRFLESLGSCSRASVAFGSLDCQPVCGSVPPLVNMNEVREMFGKNRGIQGHQNSCYLDATLFSMFAFTSVFDNLLFRPPLPSDIKEYVEVQAVLREEIVNPLRKNMYVRADRIMKLRTMLDDLSSVSGLTTEEKDPEEFLHSLLAQILQADPLLQLSSGQDTYHYQLFVDKDDRLNLPSVQTLFDQSFLTSDVKLKQVPSCLIIQMPRFGKDYKMYPRILPSMVLDVTDVIEDSPRQCIICGKLAEFECKECFGHCGSGLESIAFCSKCIDKIHCHKKRGTHKSTRRLRIPPEFQMLADHCGTIPRVYMELFAVVCIETSHYVSFTRCGSGGDATWCFFDSMADRKGEQHGYNIPTVVECGDLMQWVGDEGSQTLNNVTDNKSLPDLPRRLLCDAYMCFYQSPKVMMYS